MAHTDELRIELRENVIANKCTIDESLTFNPLEIDGELNLHMVTMRGELARAAWTQAPVLMKEHFIHEIAFVAKISANDSALVLRAFPEPKSGDVHDQPNVM